MIALLPSVADAARLRVQGGEDADTLHVTLAYLGEAVEVGADEVGVLLQGLQSLAAATAPVVADGFSLDVFNPDTDDSVIVLGLTGDAVEEIHEGFLDRLGVSVAQIQHQRRPWIPHISLIYTDRFSLVESLVDRVGPVLLDRIVLALGDQWLVFPLRGDGQSVAPGDVGDVPFNSVAQADYGGAGIPDVDVDGFGDVGDQIGTDLGQQLLVPDLVFDAAAQQVMGGVGADVLVAAAEVADVGLGSLPPILAGEPVDDGSVVGEPVGPAHVLGQEVNGIHDATVTAAVNTRGWENLPIADRDTKFAFRAATDRLAAHANSVEQFSSWFFWRDPAAPANNRNSYRMPFADVFGEGVVKLVPAAVFSAAAQLSGAHGALPIIPDAEKKIIMRTIDRIYDRFRNIWDDPRQVPPWEREPEPSAADEPVKASVEGDPMPITLIDGDDPAAVTAALAPVRPPKAWFGDPMLTKPTRLRVTEEGRVFGHIATWDTCHRGSHYGNRCQPPPRDNNGYQGFLTGTTLTAEGDLVAVGPITYGGPHAPDAYTASQARDHYADAGTSIAITAAGEDVWGIWVNGTMMPGTGDVEAQLLRAHAPSGDWRLNGNGYQMIGVLAVNTPGLPVPEPAYALTAAAAANAIFAALDHEEDCGCDVPSPAAEDDGRAARTAAIIAQAAKHTEAVRMRQQRKLSGITLPVRG